MKVYFFNRQDNSRFISLGQIIAIMQACYIKGKELGCNEIFLEWHERTIYPGWDNESKFKGYISMPESGYLPIKIVPPLSRMKADFKIDIGLSNSLYEGCPPLIANPMNQIPVLNYLNKYFHETGEFPCMMMELSNPLPPYILFHFRQSSQDRQQVRNTNPKDFINLFYHMKVECGDKYQLIKIGEESPIDDKFDEVFDYSPNDITELINLINDAHLFIGSPSGPYQIALMTHTPTIILTNEKFKKDTFETYPKTYGNSAYDWIDWKQTIHLDNYDKEKIEEFIRRIL